MRKDFLPLSRPFMGEEEAEETLKTLASGWLSTGPRTRRFEEEVAAYVGAKHALALGSCTAGLHVALVAAGIGPGDEVITSPLTFPSTANVVIHVGARPVLADIEPQTYNIDPQQIGRHITSRTKAIIPVHYGGQPCAMDEIMTLAREHQLPVIEDAATAIGAKYKGKLVGGFDDRITVFSFYANKVITTGEGGILLTASEELAAQARALSLHGMSLDAWDRYSARGSWYFEVTAPGFKYNMTDLQAALGLCQLRRLEDFIARREAVCRRYDEAFADVPEIRTPTVSPDVLPSRYIYPVLLDQERLQIGRDQFIEALKAENIGTSVHYIPVHLHPYYQKAFGYQRGDFPVTEFVFDRLVCLPLFPSMSDDDVEDVVAAVRRLTGYYRR